METDTTEAITTALVDETGKALQNTRLEISMKPSALGNFVFLTGLTFVLGTSAYGTKKLFELASNKYKARKARKDQADGTA